MTVQIRLFAGMTVEIRSFTGMRVNGFSSAGRIGMMDSPCRIDFQPVRKIGTKNRKDEP